MHGVPPGLSAELGYQRLRAVRSEAWCVCTGMAFSATVRDHSRFLDSGTG